MKGLYCITPQFDRISEYKNYVKSVCSGGADIVQFRFSENISNRERAGIGKELRKITLKYKVSFIVNNDVLLAFYLNADGVHLGQEDMKKLPISIVKKVTNILNKKKLVVGVSTHSLKEAIEAQKQKADYVSIGPVFRSPTKPGLKPRGVKLLKQVRKRIKIPVVAIGGINTKNIGEVTDTGVDAVAVISASYTRNNAFKSVQELKKRLR